MIVLLIAFVALAASTPRTLSAAEKPVIVISRFEVRSENAADRQLEQDLPSAIQGRLNKLGGVSVEMVTSGDFELFGSTADRLVKSAKFFVGGRVDVLSKNVRVTVDLDSRRADGSRAQVRSWEAIRDNDISIHDWAKRVTNGIYEAVTQTSLRKAVFVYCFNTEPGLRQYRWKVPSRLAIFLASRQFADIEAVKTFDPDEIRGTCEEFRPVSGSMVAKYDFVLIGDIVYEGSDLQTPIVIRSTVDAGSRTLGGPVRERNDLEHFVRKLAEHFHEHWPGLFLRQ